MVDMRMPSRVPDDAPWRVGEPTTGATASRAVGIADSLTSREWDQLVDIVVRRMERRLADDLERRGRRSNPRVW